MAVPHRGGLEFHPNHLPSLGFYSGLGSLEPPAVQHLSLNLQPRHSSSEASLAVPASSFCYPTRSFYYLTP